MTRINLVEPSQLTDKHLIAEYKEITRPFGKMKKRLAAENPPTDIPPVYILGKGHETFFFDKLKWLYGRYQKLFNEMLRRGFWPDKGLYKAVCDDMYFSFHLTKYWNDYQPTPEEIYRNMARLANRQAEVDEHINDELFG